MAFTVYGLMTSNATAGGPYWTSSDVVAITGINPAVGTNIFGFVDNEMRGRFFQSSNALGPAGAEALPTLAAPNFVPAGYVQLGTSAIYAQPAQAFVPDPAGGAFAAAQAGMLFFSVSYAAGGRDAGSPVNFWVDPSTPFFIAAATAEFP
jgi:hypothetical protein